MKVSELKVTEREAEIFVNARDNKDSLIEKISQPGYEPTSNEISMLKVIYSGKLEDYHYVTKMEDAWLIYRISRVKIEERYYNTVCLSDL